MQSKNNIPWNVTPRNGINTFFTEESYAKWFGRESHESRLAANLQKIGIILPPVEQRTHVVEKQSTVPTIQNKDPEGKSDNTSNAKPVREAAISRDETTKPRTQEHVLKPKPCTATAPESVAQNFKSEVQSTSQDHESKVHPTPHRHENTDDAEVEDRKPNIYTVTNASRKDEEVRQVASHENTSRAEDCPKLSEEPTQQVPTTKVPEGIAGTSRQIDGNAPRPDLPKEPAQPIPQTKVLEETGGACKLPTQPVHQTKVSEETSGTCKPPRQLDGNAPRPDLPTTLSTDAERPASKEEIKKIMKENIFYFNYKDRTDKYIPKIFGRKPTKKRSNLTAQEQRSFFNLHKTYRKGLPLHPNPDEQERIGEYKRLLPIVKKEQSAYQNYLKFAAGQCEDDYRYIHPDANKYITAKLHGKARRVWSYPRYYRHVMKFDLPDKIPDNPPTLQYVRPLLEMGHVARLVLPSIIPGCPQPCTPTSYSEVSSVCPPIPDKATGPLVWDREECSADLNLEQLAVPNKCNVALSASALKYLVDHQGYHRKFWDMPITVREYNLTEGDSHVLHRVIYIDKPLIKTSEFSMRDKQVMYQKYALKTAAHRPKQKMVVYSKIKPVATVTKAPDPEAVVKEIASWESKVKATSAISDDSTDESAGSDDGSSSPRKRGNKFKNKRDRKREKKAKEMEESEPAVKEVGMFDLEKDIDDLETFGMDSPPKNKLVKGKADGSESKGKGKRRTFLENELDLLQQVKLLAKKDVAKVPEVSKGGQKTTDEKYAEDPRSKASGAMVRQGSESNVQNNETGARNKVSGTTQAQEEIPTSVSNEKETKRKPRKLSTENVSSFSAIMKRMSTVKAKLMERDGKQPSDEHSVKPGGTSTEAAPQQPHTTPAYSVRTRSTESQEMETKMDTDSDSDAEKDDLVIDMPEGTESPAGDTGKPTRKGAGVKKSETVEPVHETIESPPASPPMDQETPQSPVFEQPQSPDTASDSLDTAAAAPCVMIPLDNEEVVRDYSAVKFEHIVDRSEPVPQTTTICHQTDKDVKVEVQDNIKEDKVFADSEQDSPARATRGAKRRSSDMIKPEATKPKRSLRSTGTNEETVASVADSKDDASIDEQSPLPARGRGRKRELAAERFTRSRSVSMESPSTSPATGSRRATRHSLDSAKHSQDSTQPSMEPPSDPEVPVKKRRGRPPKKQVTEEPQTIDTDSDKPHTTATVGAGNDTSAEDPHKASIDRSKGETSDEDKPVPRRRGRPPKVTANDARAEGLHKASIDSSKDEVSDEEKPVPRRRGRPPKITGNDSHAEDVHKASIDSSKDEESDEEKPVPRRRGRPPKVTAKDASAEDLQDEVSDEDKSAPRKRGRPPKKNMQDQIEAKKVHEMAQAMKKKIAASIEEKAKSAIAAKPDTCVKIQPTVQRKSTTAFKVDTNAKTQPTAQGMSTAAYKADTNAKTQPTAQGMSTAAYKADTNAKTRPTSQGKVHSRKPSEKVATNVDTVSADSSAGQLKLNFYTKAEPEAEEKQSKDKPSKGQVGSGQTGQGQGAGLDSILTMQKELLKPETDLKGLSSHEQFASQHGMGRVVFPAEGNVTYHQWKLADTQVLIRCSYHGHSNPQGIVHLVPKIEYQPIFGFERETPNDTCRNWISVYVRPNSTLVRTRINPYNSEVMMLENVNFSDLIPQGSPFKSLKAFSHLDTIFEQLKSLKAGQYLLRNNPLIGKLRILEAADEGYNSFDLHKQHASFTKGREVRPVQWLPIDLRLLLPHHKSRQLVPCLYQAKDMNPGAQYPKKKAKKKKKNRPQ